MREGVNLVSELNHLSLSSKVIDSISPINLRPDVICGWCGAKEHYITEHKTECPNCEEYLD